MAARIEIIIISELAATDPDIKRYRSLEETCGSVVDLKISEGRPFLFFTFNIAQQARLIRTTSAGAARGGGLKIPG